MSQSNERPEPPSPPKQMSLPEPTPQPHIPAPSRRTPEPRTLRKPRSARWESTWVRLPVLFVLLLAVNGLTTLINGVADATPVTGLLSGVATAGLALGAYVWLVRRLESRRNPAELRPANARSELRTGALLGLGMFSLVIAVIAMGGGYHLEGWGSFGGALTTLGLMTCVAVTEELAFRGALFRVLEEKTGTWGALAASGLLFGALHMVNPDATVWGGLAIAVEAGLLFGSLYAATRSLWLPIGLHLGWNMAEGGVFGTTVSGSDASHGSLFSASVSGPEALTGGAFGPEASPVAIVICLIPTVLFLREAKRRDRFCARARTRAGR
ncbi:type II CAAX prenyl endopeptidase Rce1 family protein [Streptomyces sp. OE57]|uniref:CPBP family glutamic-type intramembrane protease n=1 Tax=Streptomyces lacaronensis TaxID=3379885 RepID=UPI0039B75949